MKVKWLGHSCFLITSEAGAKVITDPYQSGLLKGTRYGKINESADVVTVSHMYHFDHNNVAAVQGSPEVITEVGTREIKGIEIKGVASYHDKAEGQKRAPILYSASMWTG